MQFCSNNLYCRNYLFIFTINSSFMSVLSDAFYEYYQDSSGSDSSHFTTLIEGSTPQVLKDFFNHSYLALAGDSPFHLSVDRDFDATQLFLKLNEANNHSLFDINAVDSFGHTPLARAITHHGNRLKPQYICDLTTRGAVIEDGVSLGSLLGVNGNLTKFKSDLVSFLKSPVGIDNSAEQQQVEASLRVSLFRAPNVAVANITAQQLANSAALQL
jgi:hypothetical protein